MRVHGHSGQIWALTASRSACKCWMGQYNFATCDPQISAVCMIVNLPRGMQFEVAHNYKVTRRLRMCESRCRWAFTRGAEAAGSQNPVNTQNMKGQGGPQSK